MLPLVLPRIWDIFERELLKLYLKMFKLKEDLKIIKEYLKLNSEVVGVRLLKDDIAEGHPTEGQFYCWFVRESAVSGKGFNLSEKDFTCPNPELCLGLREPKYVEVELRVKEKFRTVQVGDAENADVLLFIVNPRQLMELSILLGGITASFRGETAVCGEATARCYIEKKPSLTLLCHGARDFSGYKDDEMVLAVPVPMVSDMVKRINELKALGH